MKRKTPLKLLTALVLAVATSSVTYAADNREAQNTNTSAQQAAENRMIGQKVYNNEGAELGSLNQLVRDPDSGRVNFAVIRTDAGDRAIPYNQVRMDDQQAATPRLTLNTSRERLDKAPAFTEADGERLNTSEGSRKIAQYWEASTAPSAKPSDAAAEDTSGSRQSAGTGGSSDNTAK